LDLWRQTSGMETTRSRKPSIERQMTMSKTEKKQTKPVMKLKLNKRQWNRAGKRWSDKPTGNSVVYLSFLNETVLDNLANRTSRPHVELKPFIVERLQRLGINTEHMRWNPKAGCGMCPCSPGFVLPNHKGYDIWVTVGSDVKPRTNDEEAHHRAAQIMTDPTMPPLGANTLDPKKITEILHGK